MSLLKSLGDDEKTLTRIRNDKKLKTGLLHSFTVDETGKTVPVEAESQQSIQIEEPQETSITQITPVNTAAILTPSAANNELSKQKKWTFKINRNAQGLIESIDAVSND